MFWLLLLHQIPPSPPYLRAKILRRLNQLGALAIKNSAYLLPENDDTIEDFNWVQREIRQQGGNAWLFRSEVVSGWTDEAIYQSFRAQRGPDYVQIAESGRTLIEAIRTHPNSETNYEAEFRKLKRRFDEVRRIDFFDAPEREGVETIMNTIDRTLHTKPEVEGTRPGPEAVKGRTWVTRHGVKIDRIASAWFVRRFIDSAAKFAFVDPANYSNASDHVRFDMFEGEFTHENDMCTFEVLLKWSGVDDAALRAVAEVVHDIDLKDGKYQRAEAAGIRPLIEGIALLHADDVKRVEEGSSLFESLYARFRT